MGRERGTTMAYEISLETIKNLTEEERETLFSALIYARDINGSEYEGDFDATVLDLLINKLFPD
jgi:hypothetical protein